MRTTTGPQHIVGTWGPLDSRLRSFAAGTVELQLTVKERDTPSQRTTLEWIALRAPEDDAGIGSAD